MSAHAVEGDLTIYNAVGLREQLAAALAAGAYTLDLSACEACDAAGLQLLVAARRSAQAQGRRVQLTAVPAPVAELLQRFGLAALMDTAEAPQALPEETA